MQSLLLRVTSWHSVELIPVRPCQNHYTTWNAFEFISLNSCFCWLLVMKLILRLLTEHSVFLLLYKYSGSFTVSKRSNFGDDTQLIVSPVALWQNGVFYQSFSQLSWEATHSFSFLQVPFFCLLPLPFQYKNKQAAHPNMRTYYFCTDTAKEMESWMKAMTDAALVQAEPVKRSVPVLSLCQGKENILLEGLNEEKQKLNVALLQHFLVLILNVC